MTAGTLLGIVAALEPEAIVVRRSLRQRSEAVTHAGRLWRGSMYGQDTVLLRSGMGAARAVSAATWLVHNYPLHGLLSLGFAGGLQPTLATGDILLPQYVLTVSGDIRQAMIMPAEGLPVDADLARLAATAAAEARLRQHYGTLVSIPDVLEHATTKQHFGQRSGALAVDMESYSIGQVALAYAIPFMTLRTIFDTCQENVPFQIATFTTVDGAIQPLRAVRYLAAHPHALLHTGPAWRKARQAGHSLARWLRSFIPRLRDAAHAREDLQCRP